MDSFRIAAGQISTCAVSAGHVSTVPESPTGAGPFTIPTARGP